MIANILITLFCHCFHHHHGIRTRALDRGGLAKIFQSTLEIACRRRSFIR